MEEKNLDFVCIPYIETDFWFTLVFLLLFFFHQVHQTSGIKIDIRDSRSRGTYMYTYKSRIYRVAVFSCIVHSY